MNELHHELADRILGTISDLDGIVERITRAWAQAQRASDDQDVYLDSAALNLHGFYSGLERLFEVVARQFDQAVPATATWHRDLLLQMARELSDIRPAVISRDNAAALDEFRRFRHLVRNVYTVNIVPAKMSRIVSVLPDLWAKLRAELSAFADFMEDLAAQ
jgi:hypothetical protein